MDIRYDNNLKATLKSVYLEGIFKRHQQGSCRKFRAQSLCVSLTAAQTRLLLKVPPSLSSPGMRVIYPRHTPTCHVYMSFALFLNMRFPPGVFKTACLPMALVTSGRVAVRYSKQQREMTVCHPLSPVLSRGVCCLWASEREGGIPEAVRES